MRYRDILAVVYTSLAEEWVFTRPMKNALSNGARLRNWPGVEDCRVRCCIEEEVLKLVILRT